MPDRFFVQQWPRDRFFQILRVIRFDDKTTRNQRRSTDKLAPIMNVFESKINKALAFETIPQLD